MDNSVINRVRATMVALMESMRVLDLDLAKLSADAQTTAQRLAEKQASLIEESLRAKETLRAAVPRAYQTDYVNQNYISGRQKRRDGDNFGAVVKPQQ